VEAKAMREQQRQFNTWENGPDFERARTQIATPFQYVDIALDVATSNQIFNISGDFIYVDASSTGVVTLELNNQYNDASAPFQASPGFGLNALFKQVKLSWAAQVGKKVRILYSTGDKVVPTNSTTINGYVNTVDGGLSRTLAGIAFVGSVAAGVVAAQYAHGQLWNPLGSGKSLFLEAITLSSATAQVAYFGRSNAALPTAGAATLNKLLGASSGVGLLKFTNNAVQQYAQNGLAYSIAANSVSTINFREPLVAAPGTGFVAFSNTLATDLTCNFEWYEQ
jgi:hypothetical protein